MNDVTITGLDELLRDCASDALKVKKIKNEIAREVAAEILGKAVQNASGPRNKSKKKKGSGRQDNDMHGNRKISGKAKRFAKKVRYSIKPDNSKAKDVPYPVSVITGTFKRAHKIEKVTDGTYRVYGDQNIANYFNYIHDGTWKMKPRPTIDDAAIETVDSDRHVEIAMDIINKELDV